MRFLRAFLAVALLAFSWAASALTPGQRVVLLSGVPFQIQKQFGPLAPYVTFYADDTTGFYWAKGVGRLAESQVFSNTRTGTRWYANASGVYVSAPSNQTLVMPDGTGAPLLQSITNKCTNYNANPTDLTGVTKSGDAAATLTVVDDTAALLAAGLQNIATSGKVFKLDNSSGSTSAFAVVSGVTGNTNASTLSAYARVSAGSGFLGWDQSVTGRVTISGSTYSRIVAANLIPGSSTYKLTITAPAGAVVYFILNSLVENSFDIPSPVVVAGASATVGADIRKYIGTAAAAAATAKGYYAKFNASAGGSSQRFLDNGTRNIQLASTTTAQITDGSTPATATFGSGSSAGTVKLAASFSPSGLALIVNNGTRVTSGGNWTPSGSFYDGNNSAGTAAYNGLDQEIAFFSVDPTTTAGLTTP